ncbi:MAG TPA: HD domain-containing phosphohydrolase [bacterium]
MSAGPERREIARVLLVDDEPQIRRVFGASLAAEGFEVGTAASAAEALAELERSAWDAAIVDHRLGPDRGLDVIGSIRERRPEVVCVLMTALGSTELAVRALKAGAADFIAKPFTLAQLLRSLEHAGRVRAVARERREMLAHLERLVEEKTRSLQRTYTGMLAAMAQAVEKKDHGTYGHSRRVSYCARLVVAALGLGADEREVIRVAALLHDIGKIGIADSVLGKAGPLDEGELRMMRSHPRHGVEILGPLRAQFPHFEEVLPAILHHHERFDGGGYPGGLAGERIPLSARVIALADTYDAILSARPYRAAADHERACSELRRCAGTQFDPRVVEAFLAADARFGALRGGAGAAVG